MSQPLDQRAMALFEDNLRDWFRTMARLPGGEFDVSPIVTWFAAPYGSPIGLGPKPPFGIFLPPSMMLRVVLVCTRGIGCPSPSAAPGP